MSDSCSARWRQLENPLAIPAVAGLRRAGLAALQWADVQADVLVVVKAVELVRTAERGKPDLRLAPTKTANRCRLRLDQATLAELAALRAEREAASPFVFSLDAGPPSPARIGWWWSRARRAAGIDPKWRLQTFGTGRPRTGFGSGHDLRTVSGRLGHANPVKTHNEADSASVKSLAKTRRRWLEP